MSKRGLSFDEKREKMQSIFFDSADVFQLKDLEKLGPKKGVSKYFMYPSSCDYYACRALF